ncbi:MAG TPA: mandelate racemase/muconate lactonizing enzyme family protein [Jatrophihabitans sp.]|nr:mandelate racemase/muconate lactonizing enzyme family protein [Jatrophihabitans sp.]
MRITDVTAVPVTFALDREPMSFLFVRVETDTGVVGWGEACDSYGVTYAGVLAATVRDAFAPLLVGQELVAAGPLATLLRLSTRRRLGDQWVAVQARSAVEIARWDAVARAQDRSVTDLIGRVRDSVPVYASSTFLDEGPADMHLDLLAPLLERGVRMAKVRTGPDWQRDLQTLAEVRAKLPEDVELMVDGSETYTLPTALEIADRLHELGIRWFEEPIPQVNRAAIARLCEKSRVPIAYGEHLYGREEAIDALSTGGISVFQPDASVSGGITETRDAAHLAAFYGARVVPHVCAGPVSLAANLVVAGTVPAIRAIEYPLNLLPVWDALGDGAALGLDAIVDGAIPVPDGPGLGVALAEAVAAEHPYAPPGRRVAGTVGGLPDRFVGDR